MTVYMDRVSSIAAGSSRRRHMASTDAYELIVRADQGQRRLVGSGGIVG